MIFNPDDYTSKLLPQRFINNLLTKKMTPRQAALRALVRATALSKAELSTTIVNALNVYNDKASVDDPKLVTSRLKNLLAYAKVQDIKDQYKGKRYRWLPSSAITPDPEHQLRYGKIYTVGVGEMPCERYGCQCGIEILKD